MSMSFSLSVPSDSTRERVAALQLQVAAREHELNDLKTDLQLLQTRYLDKIGPLYAELMPLDAAVIEEEIRLGLRLADEEDDFDMRGADVESSPCAPASAPSADLKRMFRDIAKAVHPDRATDHHLDERTRYRRHSLMAEANQAYAERDADRLRLILRAWELDSDAAATDDPDAERARLERRAASLGARLVEIEAEFSDLRRSAIARLKTRIDDARAQGWDLFAEMMRQVRREIATAHAKLARMKQRR
jgi:hypothetical protein